MPDGGGPGNALIEGKYSDSRRRMIDLVNRLRAHGAQLDLDLPQIAVIGNQSAGKSSLIESISGISLPRASGTCTRCPTECKLSQSTKPWQCSVTLRFITDVNGNPIHPVKNVEFGPVITDKSEIEDRLRRAQLAILNPSAYDHTVYLGDTIDVEDVQQKFSHNYISLQISGPDVPDLAFVDLPGIIASTKDKSEQGNIQLVKSLVEEHISRESCIILLTVSCETDTENQGAFDLARTHDPKGLRTIGVLTKPDRIDEGDAPKWIPIIENIEEPLHHGWYAVKQRNTKDLNEGVSREVARQQEADFFAHTAPWSNLVNLKQRFGTPRLTIKLSEILTNLIMKCLPQMQEEVAKLLDESETALRNLPAPPSEDAVSELLFLISDFSRTISRDIQGTPDMDGLIQSVRGDYQIFRKAIRSTAPDFRPFPRNRDAANESFLNPDFIPEDEHIDDHKGGVYYVDEVMDRARRSITRELPDNYPFVVTQEYIRKFVKLWDRPARDLFVAVERLLVAHLNHLIEKFFEQHTAGGLSYAVKNATTQYLNQCKQQTGERLAWLLELEQEPFTLNDHYFQDYKKKYLNAFRLTRQRKQHPDFMRALGGTAGAPHPINVALAQLQAIGLSCKAEDLSSLLKPDMMDTALKIMAETRAFYHVAYKRYTDNIPMAIDLDYLRAFGRGIERHLVESLGVSSSEARARAEGYMQEADEISQQREHLRTRMERLEKARDEFLELY